MWNKNLRSNAYIPLLILSGLIMVVVPYGFFVFGAVVAVMIIDLIFG